MARLCWCQRGVIPCDLLLEWHGAESSQSTHSDAFAFPKFLNGVLHNCGFLLTGWANSWGEGGVVILQGVLWFAGLVVLS
jgi:hypothetical protein